MAQVEKAACNGCGAEIWVDPRDPNPECEGCQKKYGRYNKKWPEMTLEEKVEDLHRRVSQLGL